MSDENFSKMVIGKVEFSATTTVARPQTFQVVVPSTVAKPEPSVPLSAIRALVQQWREQEQRADGDAAAYSQAGGDYAGNAHAFLKERRIWKTCADQLAALCPAPPEET